MILRSIGKIYLRFFGWKLDGYPPADVSKFVMIAAPHTTNWDFPFMIAVSWAMSVRLRWLGKDSLFRFPYGWFFRLLGGIPVNRSKRNNLVQQVAETFNKHERLIVTVPAEGTRSGGSDHWKSGFYRMAIAAGVPVALGFLDFGGKRGGIGGMLYPTGNVKADMDTIRAFYTPTMAKYPELFRIPRLRDEDAVLAGPEEASG